MSSKLAADILQLLNDANSKGGSDADTLRDIRELCVKHVEVKDATAPPQQQAPDITRRILEELSTPGRGTSDDSPLSPGGAGSQVGGPTVSTNVFSRSLQDELALSILRTKYETIHRVAGQVVLLEQRHADLVARESALEQSTNLCKNEVLQRTIRLRKRLAHELHEARKALIYNRQSLTNARLSTLYSLSLAQKQLTARTEIGKPESGEVLPAAASDLGAHSTERDVNAANPTVKSKPSNETCRQLQELVSGLRSDGHDRSAARARAASRSVGSPHVVVAVDTLSQPVLSPNRGPRLRALSAVSPSSLGPDAPGGAIHRAAAQPSSAPVSGTEKHQSEPYFHYSASITYALTLLQWAHHSRSHVDRSVAKWLGIRESSTPDSSPANANKTVPAGRHYSEESQPSYAVHVMTWEQLLADGFSHHEGDFSKCIEALSVDIAFKHLNDLTSFLTVRVAPIIHKSCMVKLSPDAMVELTSVRLFRQYSRMTKLAKSWGTAWNSARVSAPLFVTLPELELPAKQRKRQVLPAHHQVCERQCDEVWCLLVQ